MLKNLPDICRQLDEVESEGRTRLRLDPKTPWERFVTMLVISIAFCAYWLWPIWGEAGPYGQPLGAAIALFLIVVLWAYNEFWVLDLQSEQLMFYRSLWKIQWPGRSYPLSELTALAVAGSKRSYKGSEYWLYGVVAASQQGANLPLFPELDSDYAAVVEVAGRLSKLLTVPLLEPRPFGEVAYCRIDQALKYTTGEVVVGATDVEEVRRFDDRFFEFEKKQSTVPQRVIAALGMLVLTPCALEFMKILTYPGTGVRLIGLSLIVPVLIGIYFLADWFLFPIVRCYEFVDGKTREVGRVFIRKGRASRMGGKMEVPADVEVVGVERMTKTRILYQIQICSDQKSIFDFDGAHDGPATRAKAEVIAEALEAPMEWQSATNSP